MSLLTPEGGLTPAFSTLGRRPEAVEEGTNVVVDPSHDLQELFLGSGVRERSAVDGLVARIADQLLRDIAGFLVAASDVAGLFTLI